VAPSPPSGRAPLACALKRAPGQGVRDAAAPFGLGEKKLRAASRPGRGSRLSRRLRVQAATSHSGLKRPRQPRILRLRLLLLRAKEKPQAATRRRSKRGSPLRRIRSPARRFQTHREASLAGGEGKTVIGKYSENCQELKDSGSYRFREKNSCLKSALADGHCQ
jgi:hypothetical protein